MFAKEFTHKNGLYTAMHNVKYVCINMYKQKKCVLTRKTHFVKSVIFYLKSVALYKYN